MLRAIIVAISSVCILAPLPLRTQTVNNISVLRGLATVTDLPNTLVGRVALGSNFINTNRIQSGASGQPTLLPFTEQQQQALKDAFIAGGNISDLAEGLGTTLASAYLTQAHYISRSEFSNISQSIADLIAYTNATTLSDSGSAKFFFANATTDGKTPVSDAALAILKERKGTVDVFGKSYGLEAGSPGADVYGNSRPFQTLPAVTSFISTDFFSMAADNRVYNRGPIMNLANSPCYPSGHSTYGYMGSILLALLVPQRYTQMITRAAEYGNDRIIMGAHYEMDVIAGRTISMYDLAHLLANDPAYMGQSFDGAPVVNDYQAAFKLARADLTTYLERACRHSVEFCAGEDISRFSDAASNDTFYRITQTYNLPVVHVQQAKLTEDVSKIAPEAGNLLTAAFPTLTLEQADQIRTETEGPGGGFLDDGSAFGLYSRLNLYDAAIKAAHMAGGG
jgi:membrane-associated phospholipid phosphatase